MDGIDHLDRDSTTTSFVDQDAGVYVETAAVVRPHIERLVDRVLVLDAIHRHALETERFIERDRLPVVVHHRQVEIAAVQVAKILGKRADQRQANACNGALWIDRQRPQAGTAIRIVKGTNMIDPCNHTEQLTGLCLLRDQQAYRTGLIEAANIRRRERHHATGAVDAVQRIEIAAPGATDMPTGPTSNRHWQQILLQGEPVGMRRIEEQRLRCLGDHDMRVAYIEADVTLPGRFFAQGRGELRRIVEGLSEDQPSPAAIHRCRRPHRMLTGVFRYLAPVLEGTHAARVHQRLSGRTLGGRGQQFGQFSHLRLLCFATTVRVAQPAIAWSRAAA